MSAEAPVIFPFNSHSFNHGGDYREKYWAQALRLGTREKRTRSAFEKSGSEEQIERKTGFCGFELQLEERRVNLIFRQK
jgi:hypothetical protein